MSATSTVADKIRIKPQARVWTSHPDRIGLLEPLPALTQTVERLEEATVALIFADDTASLRALLAEQADQLTQPGLFWVLYPKANKTDLNRDTLWPHLAKHGMRPAGQVAVDDTWSAMRFRALKPGEPTFAGGATNVTRSGRPRRT